MKRTILAVGIALTFALAGAAVAQQQADNVSDAQSLCGKGYDAASAAGRLTGPGMSTYGKQTVDANHDGTISRAEFDSACASNITKRNETK
jgi:hypothetical protein